MDTIVELTITIGQFLVGLWPIMLITILFGVFKLRKGFGAMLRTSIKWLVGSWAFFAVLNFVFYIFKMDTFHLLPEAINQKLFLSVGLILLPFEVAILIEERHKQIKADTLEEMQKLSPKDFERLVAETYRDQGHKVELVGATGDHGIDLVVNTRKGETWLVQCKKYRGRVGEPIIRDFYGAMRAANADAGAVITTGTITAAARLWAEGKPIFLYDGEDFLDVMRSTRIRKSLPESARKKTAAAALSSSASMQPAFAGAAASAGNVAIEASAAASAIPLGTSFPMKSSVEELDPVMEEAEPYPPQDKRPFMNLNEVPVCPACGVPMLLKSERRLFFKPKKVYICQNAPSCDEVVEA